MTGPGVEPGKAEGQDNGTTEQAQEYLVDLSTMPPRRSGAWGDRNEVHQETLNVEGRSDAEANT